MAWIDKNTVRISANNRGGSAYVVLTRTQAAEFAQAIVSVLAETAEGA
jgi:hypothetical protein